MVMPLVPVQCRGCSRFYLESAWVVVAGNVLCECGGIARALPSRSYTARDESLFDAIVSSLAAVEISSLTAPALLVTLHGRQAEAPGAALSRLTELEPRLAVIQLLVAGDPEVARQAEAMLESLLEAIAATRSRSDWAPRSVTTAQKRHGSGQR